jgi:hypothetical protein
MVFRMVVAGTDQSTIAPVNGKWEKAGEST